jgi:hypothetical protein
VLWLKVLLILVSVYFFINGWRHFVAGSGLKRISEGLPWPRWLKASRVILRTESYEEGAECIENAAARGGHHITYSAVWWVLTGIVLKCLSFVPD